MPSGDAGMTSKITARIRGARGDSSTEIRRDFAWGFVAQAFSSATNFGLVLIAGRLLGPEGLGLVAIGLGSYQLLVGLQRAFVAQPIVAYSAPLPAAQRRELAEAGLTIVVFSGAAATIILVVAGIVVDGNLGRALLIVAPWVAVAALQEYWKAILFQERSGRAGAASDCVRLVVLCIAAAAAVNLDEDYAIVGAWGLAATAGLAVAVTALPLRPKAIRQSVDLWWEHVSRLGLWLGAREVAYLTMTYATIVGLALIMGTSDLGGLRSAEALFSPWSLIAAALVLPALPALSRAAARSHHEATRLAVKISLGATGLGLAYFLVMVAIGPWLLTLLFGSEFSSYDDLVWPMGVTQVSYAATYSFNLLLPAEKRGAAFFAAGVVWAAATLACATGFALAWGVTGAAWGMAAGAAIGSVFVVWLSLRRPGHGSPQSAVSTGAGGED